MGKAITDPNVGLRLFGVYANNVDFSKVDENFVDWATQNPKEAGAQFQIFLHNRGRVIIGEPRLVPIDRSTPFDPSFIGAGWTMWKGPIGGDGLNGEEEQDSRSLALTEVDLTKVRFETGLVKKETSIKGETKLARLKEAGHIRLDAKVFQTFWQNQYLIPPQWKEKTNGNITYIFFDGTILRDPNGRRYVLSLYWDDGQWQWLYGWLGHGWFASDPSAVLESESPVDSEPKT